MTIKDLHDKVSKHARLDVMATELSGLTVAIDASPYCIKAWYNDVPSFFLAGATRTHAYRSFLARMINGLVSAGADLFTPSGGTDAGCSLRLLLQLS